MKLEFIQGFECAGVLDCLLTDLNCVPNGVCATILFGVGEKINMEQSLSFHLLL